MSKNIITKTLLIDGMTCVSCENRIERKLGSIMGVENIKVSYRDGTAVITFDANVITQAKIEKIIESLDYRVIKAGKSAKKNVKTTQIIGIGIVIFSLYMLLNSFGVLNMFNVFPEAKEGMGYGMLFVIGLLTSIHCVAMCGGINLSQCISHTTIGHSKGGKLANLRPSLLYNLGRVIAYTIVGGIVGSFGKVVSFPGPAKGFVQLAAGIFMVIMGLNMLDIFPWFRKLNPRMPKIFSHKINREKAKSGSPFYVGLLNGLMPCGPLQAMQLYALSTGDPVKGALSMLLFSLGTVPLMFGLGTLSSFLNKKFMGRMMTASAVLVIVLGVFMFSNGMNLSNMRLPSLTSSPQAVNTVKIENGVQIVTTKLSSGSYEPITVQAGIPVKWTIRAESGTVNGCNNRIIIPEYNNLEKKLAVGDNIIEFTPTKTGVFSYSCWMGMIWSNITVVDDIKTVGSEAIKRDVEKSQADFRR